MSGVSDAGVEVLEGGREQSTESGEECAGSM